MGKNSSLQMQDNQSNFNGLTSTIEDFKGLKKELKGSGWNEYRRAVSGFIKPAANLESISSDIESKVQEATNEIDRIFDSYSGNVMPPVPINNFGNELDNTDKQIRNCNTLIEQYKVDLYTKSPLTKKLKYHPEVQRLIDEQEKIKENLKKYKVLLCELQKVKNKYFSLFNEIKGRIKNTQKQF